MKKPQSQEGWISGGFFVCSKKVLDYLSSDDSLIFEREPIRGNHQRWTINDF